MKVYRVAKNKRIKDLTGFGARINGGRWNRKGTSIIYTSENRSLARLEFLARAGITTVPPNISISTLEIADHIIPKSIQLSKLPKNWTDYPAPSMLSEIGTRWANDNGSLLLRVPSAVSSGDFNILINPSHPDMKFVKIKSIERCEFDSRLLK